VKPTYTQQHFPLNERKGVLKLLISPDGREGSIATYQEGLLYSTLLEKGASVTYLQSSERIVYVHIAKGEAVVNGEPLQAGDAIILTDELNTELTGVNQAEILLFDLPR
jgi:hypothetical protein